MLIGPDKIVNLFLIYITQLIIFIFVFTKFSDRFGGSEHRIRNALVLALVFTAVIYYFKSIRKNNKKS